MTEFPAQILSVAIVDDDESVRKALRRLLTAANFTAVAYHSGEAFLDSLATRAPDCVILDLQMDGMSGLEVLDRLRAMGWVLPVIVLTGHEELGTDERCLAAGAAAYRRKPVNEESLLEAIYRVTSPPGG